MGAGATGNKKYCGQTVKYRELSSVMTFIDWVAPTGAVFVFDRTERLQGRSTIGLLAISRPVKFGAGSQQLLRCPITVLVLIPQAEDLCFQLNFVNSSVLIS